MNNEIPEQLLIDIGKMSIAYSTAEYALTRIAAYLLLSSEYSLAMKAMNPLNFGQKADRISELLDEHVKQKRVRKEVADEVKKTLSKVKAAADKRHQFIHSWVIVHQKSIYFVKKGKNQTKVVEATETAAGQATEAMLDATVEALQCAEKVYQELYAKASEDPVTKD